MKLTSGEHKGMELKLGHPFARPAFLIEVRRSHLYAVAGRWAVYWERGAWRPVVSRDDEPEAGPEGGDCENKLSVPA